MREMTAEEMDAADPFADYPPRRAAPKPSSKTVIKAIAALEVRFLGIQNAVRVLEADEKNGDVTYWKRELAEIREAIAELDAL